MPQLGELEQIIMQTLWDDVDNPRSVREIHALVLTKRDLAYTTVMTVLDRLAKKHLVNRELEGRAWLYRSKQTRAQLIADDILGMLRAAGPDGQEEVMRELAAKLAATGQAPPCAPLWPGNQASPVTPAGDVAEPSAG